MVGREVNNIYGVKAESSEKFKNSPVVLEVEGLCDSWNFVKDISFQVHQGEILGISGMVGAGRTSLVRAIFGADKRSAGTVKVNGKVLHKANIRESMSNSIGFVPEDRKYGGLFQELAILFNVSVGDLIMRARMIMNRKRMVKKVQNQVKSLNIKISDIDAPIKSLSGGNQQKALLAKWLLLDPKVLIIDEPTRGVDVGAKAEIYDILRQLAENGVAIIVVSSEIPEILGLSNQIIVMRDGKISGRLDASEADEERIGNYAMTGKKASVEKKSIEG
jgi:ABC-type sugar transport system ATPase subunit